MAVERPAALFAGVEPLEVFVELLAELDTDTSSTDFYDRICEAICRLTTMERAAIFMADITRRRAVVVGVHGASFRDLTLSESLISIPIVQQALIEDEVVVVSDVAGQLPAEYTDRFGITTLVCTPLAAAGHTYGVICADRGGGPFDVADGERHLLWTLGKTAALVATRAQRDALPGAHPAPGRAPGARPRDPRAGDAASVRGVARAQRRDTVGRRGA